MKCSYNVHTVFEMKYTYNVHTVFEMGRKVKGPVWCMRVVGHHREETERCPASVVFKLNVKVCGTVDVQAATVCQLQMTAFARETNRNLPWENLQEK